jgi:sugar (pentulose or hexulose) kinase
MSVASEARANGPFLLGIDAGTSVCKSVLFDLEGREVAVARAPSAVQHPVPDASEADMRQVWAAVCSTIRELTHREGFPAGAIAGVGVTAAVSGAWLLDAHRQPFRNAVLWNDGRAASILARWEAEGLMPEIFAISGNALFPGMTLPALNWLAGHEPETLARARYVLCGKDWIRFKLTGEICSDESDLSQMPGDISTRAYSDRLFGLCGVGDFAHLFPPLARPDAIIGRVTQEAADETGLLPGTPVVTGVADVQASMLGAGATRAGTACSIVGTSALNNVVLEGPSFTPEGIGFQFLMPGRLWIRSLTNTAGTMSLEWFMQNFCAEERILANQRGSNVYEILEEEAAGVPIGAGGVIFHPYLNTTGVLAPFRNVAARAQFFGLAVDHERRHMLRAVYEGLALAMRELYDLLPVDAREVIVTGGGARSHFWCQMFADCTGRRMLVPEGSEFGAKGVAILAGVATGQYADLEAATRATYRVQRVHEPDAQAHRQYGKVFELYRAIYEDMQEHWWHRWRLLQELSKG